MSFLKKLKGGVKAVGKVAAKATGAKALGKAVTRAVSKTGAIAKKSAKLSTKIGTAGSRYTASFAATMNKKAKQAASTAGKIGAGAGKLGGKVITKGVATAIKVQMMPARIAVGAVKAAGRGVAQGFARKPSPAAEEPYAAEESEAYAEDYGSGEEASEGFEESDTGYGSDESDSYVPNNSETDAVAADFMSEPADGDYEEGDPELMGIEDYAEALAGAGVGIGDIAGVKEKLQAAGQVGAAAAGGALLSMAAEKLGLTPGLAPVPMMPATGPFGISTGKLLVGAAAGVAVLAFAFGGRRR